MKTEWTTGSLKTLGELLLEKMDISRSKEVLTCVLSHSATLIQKMSSELEAMEKKKLKNSLNDGF